MKKKSFVILIILGLIILSITVYLSKPTKENSEYYLVNNESGIFDKMMYSVILPDYNLGLEFKTDIREQLKDNPYIEKTLPYYPLYLGKDFNGESDELITIHTDKDSKVIDLSSLKNKSDPDSNFNRFELRAYNSEKSLLSKVDIVKKFNSDSGIYISEAIYEALNLDDDIKKLSLDTEIIAPLISKESTQEVTYKKSQEDEELISFNVIINEVIDFSGTDTTLEIAGVISKHQSFISSTNIMIPYDISLDLYNQVDKTLPTGDNIKLWKPNTYIIVCKDRIDLNLLGAELQKTITNFMLSDDVYSESSAEGSRKVFD